MTFAKSDSLRIEIISIIFVITVIFKELAAISFAISIFVVVISRKITSLFSIRENALAAICFFCAILIFFLSSIGLISIWCLQGIAPP